MGIGVGGLAYRSGGASGRRRASKTNCCRSPAGRSGLRAPGIRTLDDFRHQRRVRFGVTGLEGPDPPRFAVLNIVICSRYPDV